MIHHGDLFDVLPTLAAESVDACVCDPPYDLTSGKRGGSGAASVNLDSPAGRFRITTGGGFMGQKWDGTGVAFKVETWRAVYRVLKPGAYLVAFGGTRTSHRMVCAIEDAGFEIRDSIAWLYGSGFPKSRDLGDGKGTALKPANEPIALAWKPFKGSISACHEQHGTAALNIDACRIESQEELGRNNLAGPYSSHRTWSASVTPARDARGQDVGRWPANVALDEEAAATLDEMTGEVGGSRGGLTKANNNSVAYSGPASSRDRITIGHDDVGGASRFYYVAKPSREERDMGCHGLQERPRDDSRKEGNPGGDNPRNRGLQPRGNFHPTVKPVELMRWLVKLVTPIGGTVLDPFLGSGTTGMACVYEQRTFIGIEREAEYIDIARRRIAAVAPLFTEMGA